MNFLLIILILQIIRMDITWILILKKRLCNKSNNTKSRVNKRMRVRNDKWIYVINVVTKSLMPEHYSDVCLCKKCSMKLLSSTWKNKEYDSNEEIDRQMEKVIKLAGKYSYSPKVIEGLSSFFSSKKIDGLYRKFSGGCGQKDNCLFG